MEVGDRPAMTSNMTSAAPLPSSPPPPAPHDHEGPFDWWMPGANTAAKVGVLVSILVALVLVVLAMRQVLKRWKQQREVDDPEMLGTTALKELFFSRHTATSSSKDAAGLALTRGASQSASTLARQLPYGDGDVWLKEEARRAFHAGVLAAAQQPPGDPAAAAAARASPGPPPPSTLQLPGGYMPASSPSPSALRESGSLSQADSTAALLMAHHKEEAGRDKDQDEAGSPSPAIQAGPAACALGLGRVHRRVASAGSPLQSDHTDGPPALPSPYPSEDIESTAGTQAALVVAGSPPTIMHMTAGGPLGDAYLAPDHVVAMQHVAGIMCPGVPAIEQRLQAVLHEALHGHQSGGPASSGTPGSGVHGPMLLGPTLSGGGAPPSGPPSGTSVTVRVHTGPPPAAAPAASAAGAAASGSNGVAVVASGYGTIGPGQPHMSGTATWRGGRPVMAREILTGMRSPRDIVMLQQQPPQQLQLTHRGSLPDWGSIMQAQVPAGPNSAGVTHQASGPSWAERNTVREEGASTPRMGRSQTAAPSGLPPVVPRGGAGGAWGHAGPGAVGATAARHSVFSSVPAQAATTAALEGCGTGAAAAGPNPAAARHMSALDTALSRMAAPPLPRPPLRVSKSAVDAVSAGAAASSLAAPGHASIAAASGTGTGAAGVPDPQPAWQAGSAPMPAEQQLGASSGWPEGAADGPASVLDVGTAAQVQLSSNGAAQTVAGSTGTAASHSPRHHQLHAVQSYSPAGSPRLAPPPQPGISPFAPAPRTPPTYLPPYIDPLDESPFNDVSHQMAQLQHFQSYLQTADKPPAPAPALAPVRLESFELSPSLHVAGTSYSPGSEGVAPQQQEAGGGSGAPQVRHSSGGLSSQFSFVYPARSTPSGAVPQGSLVVTVNEAADTSERTSSMDSTAMPVYGMQDMHGRPVGPRGAGHLPPV